MAGSERRRQARMRCSVPCEVTLGRTRASGTARNVSAGGLEVVVDLPDAEQGEPLEIVLRPPGSAPIPIRALLWHQRRMRGQAPGRGARAVGVVLSDASAAFTAWLDRLGGTPARPGPAAAAVADLVPPPARPAAAATAPREDAPQSLRAFAVRVQKKGTPRTCRIVANGMTADDAAAAACAEVGPDWIVLEVDDLP